MRTPIERTPEDDVAFTELSTILSSIKESALMEEFMREILTPAEVTEIARRWRLVKLLHEGHPQREIAARLHLSLCKITRGSKELKRPGSAFKRMLEMRSEP
jgi:TrpR family transcriptional regulator, trp operon repressor